MKLTGGERSFLSLEEAENDGFWNGTYVSRHYQPPNQYGKQDMSYLDLRRWEVSERYFARFKQFIASKDLNFPSGRFEYGEKSRLIDGCRDQLEINNIKSKAYLCNCTLMCLFNLVSGVKNIVPYEVIFRRGFFNANFVYYIGKNRLNESKM